MPAYPPAVRRLLLSTAIFGMGRSIGLPYLAIYLTEHSAVSSPMLGAMLGGSVFLATLFGLYAGYLADRVNKRVMLIVACCVLALACVGMTLTRQLALAFIAMSCIEAVVTLQRITLKALLADWLEPAARAKAFSLNYTIINVAFSVGPLLGALAFGMDHAAPLWISAAFTLAATQAINKQVVRQPPLHASVPAGETPAKADFITTLHDLRRDRQLVYLTAGGALMSFVFGRFVSGYLSLYLIARYGITGAAKYLPAILLSNALGVILLQYPVGRRIGGDHLFRWMVAGAACYIIGLLGFMHADSVAGWVLATLAFTVGEVISVPADYLFVDRIAPAHKRGSYYGAQSLSAFGAALSPVVCGALLASFRPALMFSVLMGLAVSSLWLYYRGSRPQACRHLATV